MILYLNKPLNDKGVKNNVIGPKIEICITSMILHSRGISLSFINSKNKSDY